jgi:uncharacterized membrane protein
MTNLTLDTISNLTNATPPVDITPMGIFNLVVIWVLYMIFMIFILYSINKYFNDRRAKRKEEKRIAEEAFKEVYE